LKEELFDLKAKHGAPMNESLIQGTEAWLALRRVSVSASDSSIILKKNPWKKPDQLLKEKLGLLPTPYASPAMLRGQELEEPARCLFEEITGLTVFPAVVFHPEYPWMMASLDGLSIDGKTLVEIKCPGEKGFAEAERGRIPEHYRIQMQHQMLCTSLSKCLYFVFNGERGVLLECERDDALIELLIEKEKVFYECLISNSPLPLEESDYLTIGDAEEVALAWEYAKVKRQIDDLKRREEDLKRRLIEQADDGNFVVADIDGPIIKFTRTMRDGAVDWDKLCIDKKISDATVKKYRKAQIGYYTAKVCR